VTNDPGVLQQSLHVGLADCATRLELEAVERDPERLPLAQDRQPR